MQDITDAWARHARGDFQGAAELSRTLLAAAPDDPATLCCNAMSNWQLGVDFDRCMAQMQRAVALAPGDAWLWHNLAALLASIGQLEEACAGYRKAVELKPDDTQAFYALTQTMKFTEATPLVEQMSELYAGGQLTPKAQEYVCFALAKVYNDLGRYKRAIHFCIEGNWLVRRPYDAARPRADLAELQGLAAADAFRRIRPGTAPSGVTPVFIVGMPRSGTTLVESVLSRHPQVHAGGELPHLGNVERVLHDWAVGNHRYKGGAHAMLGDIPTEFFSRNAEAVLTHVRAAAGARAFSVFTDKLPENSQRLGLISLLFPGARIIYMRRHPLDCCLSNLFLHFASGNGFAFQQVWLGERYRQVAETMQAWKQSLDLPILDVSYESLVTDPESNIRRIVAFAGLDWNEACLSPEKAGRSVATANQWQVRQPINRASVDRWRHYEEWLRPLIKALGGMGWIDSQQQEVAARAA